MRRLSPALGLAALAGAVLWAPATAAGGPPTTVLRLDGIGPLHLGMTRTAALATGWLAGRRSGCPLGGTPPITYRVTGAKAPKAIKGSVEFVNGRLSTMSFTRGVRTSTGVTVAGGAERLVNMAETLTGHPTSASFPRAVP